MTEVILVVAGLVGFVLFFKAAVAITCWWIVRNQPESVDARRRQRQFDRNIRDLIRSNKNGRQFGPF